ncbi:MAG: NAD(P)H dehydrogenase assembly family protein [Synechococcus sp.]|nr:NAD(P)H dehydrogenase assembly family protein [Synechococcus sp.]
MSSAAPRDDSPTVRAPINTAALPLAGAIGTAAAPPAAVPFPIGSRVRLKSSPRYLRSADPMPMLRPPDLIDAEESGLVVELRPREQRAVRFRRGTFLLDLAQLQTSA